VAHRPTSDALRSEAALPHAVESASSYQKVRNLWLAELKRTPKSIDIHINAAHFLALPDRQTARQILQEASRLDPKNRDVPFLVGVLDGLTVIDIDAINHDGLPDATTIPPQPSQEATAALRSLEESDDARRVCGSAVVRYGSILLGAPSPSRDVLKIAASLLNRALNLDHRSPECLEYATRVNAWQAMRSLGWSAQQSQRVVIDGRVAWRWKATDVPPVYPAQARTRGLQGTVTLIAVIADDGRVKKAEAISGPDALRPAALDSFQHWTYKPPVRTGTPLEYLTDVQFHFTLSR
jgi:TonB family protein